MGTVVLNRYHSAFVQTPDPLTKRKALGSMYLGPVRMEVAGIFAMHRFPRRVFSARQRVTK
jgi:hypothetical protein